MNNPQWKKRPVRLCGVIMENFDCCGSLLHNKFRHRFCSIPTYRYMFKFSFKKPFYFQKLLYRYCSNYPLSRNCAIEAFNHKKNNVEGKIYHYIRFGNEMWVKRKHTSETLPSPAVCTYYILYIMLSNRLISYMID